MAELQQTRQISRRTPFQARAYVAAKSPLVMDLIRGQKAQDALQTFALHAKARCKHIEKFCVAPSPMPNAKPKMLARRSTWTNCTSTPVTLTKALAGSACVPRLWPRLPLPETYCASVGRCGRTSVAAAHVLPPSKRKRKRKRCAWHARRVRKALTGKQVRNRKKAKS